ncbi:hypothetical protein GCM10023165_11850 [Variovorax defluvii]|uniref:YD repeat-containing protein n=1 Tax=Variovorax defluvii TaxID=913761 RepID=A0ABP8H7C4_9BURK
MGQPSITVYVDNVGTPHAFIKLDDGQGRIDYYGFAPSTPGDPHGPGKVGEGLTTHARGDRNNSHAGFIDDVGWGRSIAIDSAQHDAMTQAVSDWRFADHTYNGLATLGGENCVTFVQAVLKAGGVTDLTTSRTSLPINLIPADERRALFVTDADGRRWPSDALTDPLTTPGTPAYEYKQSHPELFTVQPPPFQGPLQSLLQGFQSQVSRSSDWSNSELHIEPDGSIVEEVTYAGPLRGDTMEVQYTASGMVSRVTETDGARNNADYGTRTTIYDLEGRIDLVDARLDDGSSDWTDYDQANIRSDSVSRTHTDAQGRTDWVSVEQDDGSHEWTDYDQANTRGDSIWQNRVDAAGREDWRSVTLDDGSRDWTDYDQANTRGDSIWQNRVDAGGREDWRSVTLDDGSRDWTDYDQDGSQAWSTVLSHFDASGRRDYANVYQDDGSRDWYDDDQDNSQSWSTLVSHFDAQGREAHANLYMDDGSRNWFDYDQDGSQPWSRVESRFDAAGREDEANLFFDDGRRKRYDDDQDDSQYWNRVEHDFDVFGHETMANVYHDDGSRTWLDYSVTPGYQVISRFNPQGLLISREASAYWPGAPLPAPLPPAIGPAPALPFLVLPALAPLNPFLPSPFPTFFPPSDFQAPPPVPEWDLEVEVRIPEPEPWG